MRLLKSIPVHLLALVLICIPMLGQDEPLTVEKIFREVHPTQIVVNTVKWSPYSERISFATEPEKDSPKVFKVQRKDGTRIQTLISEREMQSLNKKGETLLLDEHQWLPDGSGIVIPGEKDIWLYDLNREELENLTHTDADESVIQLSENGEMVGFVRNNDLFTMDLENREEIRLTQSGSDTLLNGKLDWVYQEELVGRGNFKGFWWSPGSEYIAYLQFDESPVPEYPLVNSMTTHPELEMMRYPKAGDPNPRVRLGVIPVKSNAKTTWMEVKAFDGGYIPRVYWLPDGEKLFYINLERNQRNLRLLSANIHSGETEEILNESDEHWLNIKDQVYFFKNSDRFIWGSERSGFSHLFLYDTNGNYIKQMTSGDWLVEELLGVDESRDRVYYTSTQKSILERHVYELQISNGKITRLTETTGTHKFKYSPDDSRYLHFYNDVVTPLRVTAHSKNGREISVLEQNNPDYQDKYNLRKPEFFTFSDESGREFYAQILRPPNFNPDKKYPVIVYVYGGPNAQVVKRNYGRSRDMWHQMMAQKGFIIFSMDNRGSFGRGHDWETPLYKRLGAVELNDQLQGMNHLKSLSYVDENRIGVWGWSYGGYMTLYALAKSDVFTAGISVAPVTSWYNYDTIYTERYMSLPDLNPDGYFQSAPLNFAGGIQEKLLLVHGTADDNVHLQNSMQMVDALVRENVDFQLMLYPEMLHGISNTDDRIHLFEKMTDFFEINLK